MQHDGTGSGAFEKNTPEWENLDELIRRPNDILIDKYANDVFYKPKLQNKRSALHVNDLSITGCVSDFCTESTIQSALIKEYNIANKCFRRGLGLFAKTAKFLNLALCLTGKLMSFYSQRGKTVMYY